MPFTTIELLTVVAGSSVVAALVTQGVSIVRDWRKEKRDGKFSALYLAIALEAYAEECATLIMDSENYRNSGGHAGTPHGNIEGIPDYPDAIEWKAFGIKDTTRAMSFRVEVDTRKNHIKDYWEYGDEDDILPLVREEAARLGSKALELAKSFRKSWVIDPVNYRGEWNVSDYLSESLEKHRKRRESLEELQRKFQDGMSRIEPTSAASPTGV